MAQRKALVLVGGQIQELPAGDTLTGAGTGGSSTVTATSSFPGTIYYPAGGAARWYTPSALTIGNAVFSYGTAPTAPATVRVSAFASGGTASGSATVTLPAGQAAASATLGLAVPAGGYITARIESGAGGADAVLQLTLG